MSHADWTRAKELEAELGTVKGDQVTHTFETVGEAESVSHGLSFVPSGWMVMKQDAPGSVYALDADVAAWTNAVITLRSSAPGMTATIRILR